MASSGPEVARPALASLERPGRLLTLAAAGFCLAVAAMHGLRDERWASAAMLAGVALGTLATAWARPARARVVSIRWADHGWTAVLAGGEAGRSSPIPALGPADVSGVFALHHGALVRVRGAVEGGMAFDELLWVAGPRLEPAQWTHLRSTLRLAPPYRLTP